ncbi:hypothetical protein NUSPORA_02933 [Nucleospora cyclopteri]
MNYILEEEFGFEEKGFVFSGRRGLHCWVFGYEDIDSTVRNDIYKYFQGVIDKNMDIPEYTSILKRYCDNQEVIQQFFPRLDKQVTVKMSHLIKMPFSVHPDTMRVSIPLDPKNIKEFEELPTVYDFISKKENIEEYVKIMRSWRLQ